jgi:Uma2 family endonuclease
MTSLLIAADSAARRGGDDMDEVAIPANLDSLEAFRRWADSDAYPETGRYSWLQGQLLVDVEMEELFTHNLLKTALTFGLEHWNREQQRGYVFSDGVRLTHPGADLSVEPDVVFTTFDSVQQGRVKLVSGASDSLVELEGSPELVVEIVSPRSVKKDKKTLRELYWQAGIGEYWLIDARREPTSFEILLAESDGYHPAERRGEHPVSRVLDRPVILTNETDPLGHPQWRVEWA